LITTLASFGGATPAGCIANNQRLSELTIGFWQNEYIKRKAFNGIGGAPSTDDNGIMTSIRYYPF
jgi:hypothetical protein